MAKSSRQKSNGRILKWVPFTQALVLTQNFKFILTFIEKVISILNKGKMWQCDIKRHEIER